MITAAISAVKKPSIAIPFTKLATNHNIRALKTKVDSPKVRIVTGNVNNIKIGRITALRIPKIAATISAVYKESTVNPGIYHPIRKTVAAIINQRIINIVLNLYCAFVT
jgi:hypothetical protein